MADENSAPAAAGGGIYLYEFLYRGRAEASDFHVILAQDTQDAFGQVATSYSPAMTPDQAKEHGFDIGKIVEGINAGLQAEADAAKAALATAETERDAAKDDLADAQAKLATLTKPEVTETKPTSDEAARNG